MSVEQNNDERDLLLAACDDSGGTTKAPNDQTRLHSVFEDNNHRHQRQQHHEQTGSRGLTSWLSNIFSQQPLTNFKTTNHQRGLHPKLAAMSGWLQEMNQQPAAAAAAAASQRRPHLYSSGTSTNSLAEATYDILDDEQTTTTTTAPRRAALPAVEYCPAAQKNNDGDDDDDGFESPAAKNKSPMNPFYNMYQATLLSSYHGRRKWRLLFLASCLFVLFCLSLGLLLQLIVLIGQLCPWPTDRVSEGNGGGGTAWTQADHLLDRGQLEAGRSARWLVSSPKCHIPAIEPWHESIQAYVSKKAPLDCKRIFRDNAAKTKPPLETLPLSYTKDNQLHFTQRALKMGYSNQRCCYRPLRRSYANDDELDPDDRCYVISGKGPFALEFGLIKIMCQKERIQSALLSSTAGGVVSNDNDNDNGNSNQRQSYLFVDMKNATLSQVIYTNVHSFIVRDLEEEAALDRVASRRLNRADYYNILMVGVDTISRLNAHRQLNQTMGRLKRDYETLEFFGYNKVGENTFPNLVPLLTGLRPEQLTEIQCWQASNYSQESESGDDFMDNCKYLWNFYQDLGYITYFNEDWPKASTFNYLKQGFRHEPTTFYGRPFALARDDLLLPPVGMGCSSCLLDRPLVQVDLENLGNFLKINRKRPHFAFHWVNCPQHDDLNGASMVDSIYDEFFNQLKGFIDDRTFVIFFSDHGYRWNNFVSTRVGHYESSLPLLTIAAPKRFVRRHPDLYANLKSHQTALVTPFDMFKTLIGLRDLAKLESVTVSAEAATAATITNSKSKPQPQSEEAPHSGPTASDLPASTKNPLVFEDPQYTSGPTAATTIRQLGMLDGLSFRQQFATMSLLDAHNSRQLDRSCIGAGIPDNYCVCHEFETTPNNSSDALGAAYYLVYVHLYTRLKQHPECRLLDLEQVHRAEMYNFKRMISNPKQQALTTTTTTTTTTISPKSSEDLVRQTKRSSANISTTTPAPPPSTNTANSTNKESSETEIDEQRFLPTREYNIRLSTQPGAALFQEVVRYYGQEDLGACRLAVQAASSTIARLGPGNGFEEKHASVMKMNEVCRFIVHSDSISRLNLYKDQSKCVKSNIELKKICYCA